MNKPRILGIAGLLSALAAASYFLTPPETVVIPSQLPVTERTEHRLLAFSGIHNFRDLGGYPAGAGRQVKWGKLYRSGALHDASERDLQVLTELDLHTLVDFRSSAEKAAEPDKLPRAHGFQVVEIPTLDGGDNSVARTIMARIESGDFSDFDPDGFMLDANRHLAQHFTPQYRMFMDTVLASNGRPLLWHCSAGKDRAGFAAAVLLRVLGVPQDVVMQDYLLSKQYALDARRNQLLILRLLKGKEAADKLELIMGVEPAWLEAGFAAIDEQYGSFDNYVREALELDDAEIMRLRELLLEPVPS